MKTAVIYARYSSDKQTEQSIEGQVRVCNEYADAHDIVVVKHYIDRAMSGTNDKREEFQKMIKDSAKGKWDYVLVYKLDRFSRDKYETAIHRRTLRNNGVKLVSAMENIPDSPEGIILESLLEGMNQYFSAELSQKVKRGIRESRTKGLFTGGVLAYGYKLDGKKIIIDEDEAAIVRHIYDEYARGRLCIGIINELNRLGIQNKGKPFGKNSMQRLLSNEKYTGIVRGDNGEVYTNVYPQIIPKDLYDYVRLKMSKNRYGRRSEEIVYILRDRLFCGYCGKPVHSSSGKGRNGAIKRYYRCAGRTTRYGHEPCELKPIRKEIIEELVLNVVEESLSDELIDYVVDKIMKCHIAKRKDDSILNLLKTDLTAVEKGIENLISALENGFSTSSTKERLEKLEARKAELKDKIKLEEAQEQLYLTREDIKRFFLRAVRKEPFQMIETVVNRVILYHDKVEIYLNYQDYRTDGEENVLELVYDTTKKYDIDNGRYYQPTEIKSYNVEVCV